MNVEHENLHPFNWLSDVDTNAGWPTSYIRISEHMRSTVDGGRPTVKS